MPSTPPSEEQALNAPPANVAREQPPITFASMGTAPPNSAFPKAPAKRRIDFTETAGEINRILREMKDDTENYDTSVY